MTAGDSMLQPPERPAQTPVEPASKRLKVRFARNLKAMFLVGACAYLVLHANREVNPYSLVFNRTASIPLGLYLAKELRQEAVKHGDIVCFVYRAPEWAKQRHYFPEGSRLCKYVAGLSGDTVNVDELSVHVVRESGEAGVSVTLEPTDSKGRPLPTQALATGTIGRNQVLLIAPRYSNSLDSRYLGLIEQEALTHKLRPVWTW